MRHSSIASVLTAGLLLGTATAAAAPGPVGSHTGRMAGQVVAPSEHFGWPVTPHRVVRRFAPPAERWGAGHRGVDLASRPGVDVVAPAEGEVTFSGVIAGRGVLAIRHPQGFSTTYEPVSDRVPKGTRVHRGQRIAKLDSGHCATGACLHWGYRVGEDGYRDPLTLVRATQPILLPPLPGR